MRTLLAALAAALLLAGCAATVLPADPAPAPSVRADPAADAVVVAVIDSGINPYHHDFLARTMPQAGTPAALPLHRDPASWLPGFPGASAFASYSELALGLPRSESADSQALHDKDEAQWSKVKRSSATAVHYSWIPGTKVVGHVTFGGSDGFAPGSHGVGSASVSVGNLHGACPECLLVFVDGPSEQANRWVEAQDWIDLQTNSWGFSTNPAPLPRDRVYAGSDTEAQRAAIERGQQVFFSAGNGLLNDFSAPNPTLLSSQEGPDWIVTVGAVTPRDQAAYSGAGKPADVANIGGSYPSAYGASNVNGTGEFSGTSNATPVTAGEYARALHLLRHAMEGPSRIQANGTISVGALPCGAANPACATADGRLTVHELREALFGAARILNPELSPAGAATPPAGTTPKEATLMAVGHGALTGRLFGFEALDNETRAIAGMAAGTVALPPVADPEWFVADSHCRQGIWGAWGHGAYRAGEALPAPDPEWPVRTYYAEGCPATLGTVRAALAASPL